jgi:uncharacterized protein YbdZ (MbtH family)/acyl carrier protein
MTEKRAPERCVVFDLAGAHTVWPLGLSLPDGWREAGFEGSHDECVRHIRAVAASAAGAAAETLQVEAIVLQVWAEVLHRQGVTKTDNFFDIGGHSLAAMQVGSRLREIFGADLPIHSLFEEATAAELAALLGSKTAADKSNSAT